MAQVRTHYDNLKVARNAPPEVINAAYRAISRRLHPDTNPHPDASRSMAIVNRSYAVLADPAQRAAHDAWIRHQEAKSAQAATPQAERAQSHAPSSAGAVPSRPPAAGLSALLSRYWFVPIVAAFIGWLWSRPSDPPLPSTLPAYDRAAEAEPAEPPVDAPAPYARPANAPNGARWPTAAAYVAGYKRLRTDGLSQLTVDNSTSDGDMFVKLVAIDADRTVPIRQLYLPRGSSFTLNKVRAGTYDLRYMDLDTGSLIRSQEFELRQFEEADGIRFSRSTVTLFKVADGNLQSYALNPAEF